MSKRTRLRTRSSTSRRKNCHHLAWPNHDYHGIRKIARDLPCLKVFVDIEVHRVMHDMYNFPRLMNIEDAKLLIERHNAHVCACFTRDGVEVNMLAINFSTEHEACDLSEGDECDEADGWDEWNRDGIS